MDRENLWKILKIMKFVFDNFNLYARRHSNAAMAVRPGNSGSACQRSWQKVLDCAESFGRFKLSVIILTWGVENNDLFCQKVWNVIKNTENFLPGTLYKPGFNKLSPIWELFWMDLGLSFTRFAEIIWPLTRADRNTFHSFQVCPRAPRI